MKAYREELMEIVRDSIRTSKVKNADPISDKSPVTLEYTFVCADKSVFVRSTLASQFGNVPMKGDLVELSNKDQDPLTAQPRLFKIVKRIIPISYSERDAVVRNNVICLVCKEIVERKKNERNVTQTLVNKILTNFINKRRNERNKNK